MLRNDHEIEFHLLFTLIGVDIQSSGSSPIVVNGNSLWMAYFTIWCCSNIIYSFNHGGIKLCFTIKSSINPKNVCMIFFSREYEAEVFARNHTIIIYHIRTLVSHVI